MVLSLLGISCPQDRENILDYPMVSVITRSLKEEGRGRREIMNIFLGKNQK